jgi:hypothetical protein
MMTRIPALACAAIFIWVTSSGEAMAGITLGFDLDANTAVIEDTRTVNPGQIFEIAVYVDLAVPGNIFGDFAFDVTFNSDHVNVLQAGSEITPVGTPLPLRPSSVEQESTLVFGSTSVGPFDGDTGFVSPLNAPALFNVGVLQIEALNMTGIATDDAGLTLLGFDNLSGAVVGATLGAQPGGLNASTLAVAAIPEPTGVGVYAVLVCLTRFSRRRRPVSA